MLYANYGVTDRFDIGVAIPYVRLDMTARIDATIERLATAADPFEVHVFAGDGDLTESFVESGSAEGIGDMVVRGEVQLLSAARARTWPLATDLRLPTGDDRRPARVGGDAGQALRHRRLRREALRAARVVGLHVLERRRRLHGRAAGRDLLHRRLRRRAAFPGDPHRGLRGRTLIDADRLVLQEQTFEAVSRTDATVQQTTRVTPTIVTGNLNVLLGSVGLKVNPAGRLLLVGNVLLAIGEGGLQDEVTPVFGIEYSF